MTNFEMLKRQGEYVMALVLRCPYDAGFIGEYRCGPAAREEKHRDRCIKCRYTWLNEEAEFSYLLEGGKP